MLNRSRALPNIRVQGFTLVEMMVALVLALLVTASVLAFIFSIIRANSETVLSTRLNQELRATMAVITSELKRARGVEDPISSVGQDGSIDYDNDGDVDAVDTDFPLVILEKAGVAVTADADCVRYAYYDGSGVVYRAIYLENGGISMLTGATRAATPCAGGTPINAPHGIEITDLSIDFDSAANKRRASIEIVGGLKEPPAYMTENQSMAIKGKTIRQVVSIRSNDA